MAFIGLLRRIDRAQQRHPWVAFPLAVVRKFGEDRAGDLAALVAYYGFFSLFPLMMVLVTLLGMALRGNPSLRHGIVSSVLRDFPLIGPQIARNIHSLSGHGLALVVGLAFLLWAGLGVVKATETAMNSVWNVPTEKRPGFARSTVRASLMLVAFGLTTVLSALLVTLAADSGSRWGWFLGVPASFGLNLLLFVLAFRILTTEDLSLADVRTGAIIGAAVWTALQTSGSYFVSHQLRGANNTYGAFALVIGLLSWIYLGAQLTLFAAEVNVVKKRHLWPRALLQPPFTGADVDALNGHVEHPMVRPRNA